MNSNQAKSNLWSDFRFILDSYGVKNANDIEKFGFIDDRHPGYLFANRYSSDYDLFEAIIEQCEKCFDECIDHFNAESKKGQCFAISDGQYDKFNISHYLSLFPQRGLVFTKIPAHTSAYLEYDSQVALPIDIIEKYYDYEPLLINNIASLLPHKANEDSFKLSTWSGITLPYGLLMEDSVYENIPTIDKYGKGIKNLNMIPKCLTIALPFLKTTRIEDVVDFIAKYKDKFESLNRAMEKITISCKSENEIERLLLREINDAIHDIASSYKAKKKELARKEIFALTGICFTLIPIGLSKIFNFDPTIASSIIGGTNLLSFRPALEKYFDFREDVSNQPFWILWKWNEVQKKR